MTPRVALGAVLAAAVLAAPLEARPPPAGLAALRRDAGPAAAEGFTAAAGRVRCAVGLPHRSGLFCAAPGVKDWQYDGRGVARLLSDGRVSVVPAGSDLLLAIDASGRGVRPPLASGHTWRADGFACTNRGGAVTCRRGVHGFTVSAARYAAT